MSRFANLSTYSWSKHIDGKPFQIKVFACNVDEARREVFAILAEIARVKPHYEALDEEICRRYREEDHKQFRHRYGEKQDESNKVTPPPVKKTWAQITTGITPAEKTTEQLRKEQAALMEGIPADFFNGCYAASTFDYTADNFLGDYGEKDKTLGDFIRTTEPKCCGTVRSVSFRSCLDG
jgi:hypothetical protein